MYTNIYNGQFGQNGPMINNNIIPIGSTNYNTGYVFQPVQQQPQQYQQWNQYNNGVNYQQPTFGGWQQQNYYNRWGQSNGYLNPQTSTVRFDSMSQDQIKSVDSRRFHTICCIRINNGWRGIKMTPEEIEEKADELLYGPKEVREKINKPKTHEEINNERDFQFFCWLRDRNKYPRMETVTERTQRLMIQSINTFHEIFDHHTLFQFLQVDLPKLMREFWIQDNIVNVGGRNMRAAYNSTQYGELLNMHKSANPYVNQLLDESKFDNNKYDEEVGIKIAFNKETGRPVIEHGPVPLSVSDAETQARRHTYTSELIKLMMKSNKGRYAECLESKG